jgi:hypothetical protein
MKAARGKTVILTSMLFAMASFVGLAQVQIDLDSEDVDFTIFARDGGDGLGNPNTLALGDFNDDRLMDILFGAPGGDGPDDRRLESGEAYILYGKPSGEFAPSFNTDGIPGPDVILYGENFNDLLGSGLAAGDINGDGIDDLIVGAPGGGGPTNGADNKGELSIIFGGLTLDPKIDLKEVKEDLIVFNNTQRSRFGTAIVALDMNGDGIDDIAVADPFASGPNHQRSGAVYIIYGSRSLEPRIDIGNSFQGRGEDVAIFGADRDDQIGQSLSKGDVNNDGIEDLIIGAPFADGPGDNRVDGGEAYVIYGSFELPELIDLAATSADVTVFGADAQDQLGASVDAGDVNGDLLADILIGAPFASGIDNLRGFAGEAYVFYGKPLLPSIIDLRETDADSQIIGADKLETLGSAVHSADLNLDGRNDLILGAAGGRGPAGGRSQAGKVYAIGSPGDLPLIIDLAEDFFDLVVFGAGTGDNLGSSLAGGDLSGEGGFLLMGANGVDSPSDGPDAGAIFSLFAADIVRGGPIDPGGPRGDCDGDGVITILDAKCVCESVLGFGELTTEQIAISDVVAPFGEITLADAIAIAEAAVGLRNLEIIEEEPVDGQQIDLNDRMRVQRYSTMKRGSKFDFIAHGSSIESTQVEVYSMSGAIAFSSEWTRGNRVQWNAAGSANATLANGTYLYVVRAKAWNGRMTQSDIKKIAIIN